MGPTKGGVYFVWVGVWGRILSFGSTQKEEGGFWQIVALCKEDQQTIFLSIVGKLAVCGFSCSQCFMSFGCFQIQ